MVSKQWLRERGYPEMCPDCGSDLKLLIEPPYVKGVTCSECDYTMREGI